MGSKRTLLITVLNSLDTDFPEDSWSLGVVAEGEEEAEVLVGWGGEGEQEEEEVGEHSRKGEEKGSRVKQ